jgi:hypothetical protein
MPDLKVRHVTPDLNVGLHWLRVEAKPFDVEHEHPFRHIRPRCWASLLKLNSADLVEL